ncbi:hypothetical protein BX600DRAFT_514638 [Xylariales sp. PMI_506]|nr:hypothetical protein BX600DRAFT_514638 [Xylariales sp. PMI_506]
MKTATFLVTVIATIASSVLADSCNHGGVYCGVSLLAKGNYRDHIVAELNAVDEPTSELYIENSLWDCLSGGEISYVDYCENGCGGTDSTDPDYCLNQ